MSSEEVAARLREAIGDGRNIPRYVEVLSHLWAAEIQVRHVPAVTFDGAWTGEEWNKKESALHQAILRAVPDYRQEDVTVTATGSDVLLEQTMVGTLAEGEVSRVPSEIRFSVRDGAITGFEMSIDPAKMGAFAEVVRAAGLPVITSAVGDD